MKGILIILKLVCLCLSITSFQISKTKSPFATYLQSTKEVLIDDQQADAIRKWFLIYHQKRGEVVFSDAKNSREFITDVWKAILVSFRVLQNNEGSKTHLSLYAFRNFKKDQMSLDVLQSIVSSVNHTIRRCRLLLQPEYEYSATLFINQEQNGGSNLGLPTGLELLLLVETVRNKPELSSFDDIEEMLPAVEDALTNNIPSFPFPSVYDFISDINRPPDPVTMSSLRFNFQVADLKFDIEKMKKKNRNPQEYVDGINCRLTRLARWRDVLTTVDEDVPDPFDQTYEWSENVRRKYQSLVVQARIDPKLALDNQYDKRATFIKIIDEWSLRLKQSFKFIYESKRSPPQDFMAPILASKWRKEVLDLSQLPVQTAFLELQGPVFTPGRPLPLFNESRRVIWERSYPASLVMTEMLIWLNEIEYTKSRCGLNQLSNSHLASFGHITMHTYSRGYVTEKVLHDCWIGLSAWLEDIQTKSYLIPPQSITIGSRETAYSSTKSRIYSYRSLLAALSGSSDTENIHTNDSSVMNMNGEGKNIEKDHTEIYKDTLRRLNKISRNNSVSRALSVKEMYKQQYVIAKELVEWWTTLVRDLDLVDEMERLVNQPYDPSEHRWTTAMTRAVERGSQVSEDDSSMDGQMAAAQAAADRTKWENRFKRVMNDIETLRMLLPWPAAGAAADRKISDDALQWLERQPGIADETPVIRFSEAGSGRPCTHLGYLFVTPRYFRGIGLNEELSAFVEFAKVMKESVSGSLSLLQNEGISLEVITLHPRMIDSQGRPDYSRRSPHPAVLFRLPLNNEVKF